MKTWIVLSILGLSLSTKAFGWGKKGHEVAAYIAYQHLDGSTRKEVDYLITLNPCYPEWKSQVATIPTAQQPVALFMLAATWPDMIKNLPGFPYDCQPGHKFIFDGISGKGVKPNEDVPPNLPAASQNVGYSDNRRHKYWHFVTNPFSPDGTSLHPAPVPNAATEIVLLSNSLKSGEADALKSYDLVWIEHLVGDVHQPMHDSNRFTAAYPGGDHGGNLVAICKAGGCNYELHGYWDSLPGSNNLAAAIKMGAALNRNPPPAYDQTRDPAAWSSEGLALAKTVAYAAPVPATGSGSTPPTLNAAYISNAKKVMNLQLTIAGNRLAALLIRYLG